jgi:hypothetical protein
MKQTLHKHILEFGDGLVLGPNLTEQEWQHVLQRHREAMIKQLRAIFRKELVVSKEQRADIERAAHGMWKF